MPLDSQNRNSKCFFELDVDRVTINGVAYVPFSRSSEGYLFRRDDSTQMAESFSFARLDELVRGQKIRVEADYYLPESAQRRLQGSSVIVSAVDGESEKRMRARNALVMAFLQLKKEKRVVTTDKSIEENRALIRSTAIEYYGRGAVYENSNDRVEVGKFSARSLRRYLRDYAAAGIDGNTDNYARCGVGTSRLTIEVRVLLARCVNHYLSRDEPTLAAAYALTKADFAAENAAREANGRAKLPVPSKTAYKNAIERLPPFMVAVKRKGHEAALKAMRQTFRGNFALDRPLQRVEMDEHRIDLYTILKEQGLLEFLSEEERKRLGLNSSKGRWWWVTIAICGTTRCIVGMRMSRNPNSHAAKETLHMTMQDKGQWADAVGARSPWDMFGLPELLVTDCGPAFKSLEFRAACEDLRLRIERAIAAKPHMRGVIERLFKTMAFGLMSLLSGRTFSNVIMRGDQDPADRAVLTENDFAKALIRWVVDIYHNTPHEGLNGATPLETWRKAEETFGVRPAPTHDKLAPIFATPMTRNLAGDGIRVMGVRYHSEALGRFGIKNADKKMQIRWYPGDIGSIWVKLADWTKVDAVFDGFQGVRAEDWISAAKNLRKSQRRGQEASQEIVHAAIREIAAINAAAQAKAGLVVEDWNEDIMARVEDTLFIGFNVASAPAEPGTAATHDGIGDAVLPAIEEAPQPQPAPVNPRRSATGTMDLEE